MDKPPLVQFDDVDVCLEGQRILTDVNWRLLRGQHWAVLGGNGAGKSTFLKLIRGEISPVPRKGERVYRVGGEPQRTAVGIKDQMPLVSPEAQDRYVQLEWRRRVDEVIYTGFAGTDYLYHWPDAKQRVLADELTGKFGIAHLLKRGVQSLSTGELRRVMIVRALVRQPPVLLLDEVCDGLDSPTRRLLVQALERTARADTQIIYTTHRFEELIPSITHALVLKGGRVAFKGLIGQLMGERRAAKVVYRPQRRQSVKGNFLIQIDRANVYLERTRVLSNIAWQLRDGENWAILGPNGSGKTTFLRLVCGDIHAALGSRVKRFGFTPRNTLWELRKRIGFVSPALQASYRERLTGAQVVASGFFSTVGLLDSVTRRQQRKVTTLMDAFGAARLGPIPTLKMSYGEFRMILLLRALVHSPAVLVCDEPFDGLDNEAKRGVRAALDSVAATGTRLVIVTHHMNELPCSTTHALVLENGRIVCQGELARVRAHRTTRRLFKDE